MDLIVLGMDGADPEYLEKAMEKYELDNWSSLVEESFYTGLPSTVPAVTLPAWPCMFSGYNPGKFDVYHLAMADFDSWDVDFPDSRDFQGFFFWDRVDLDVGLHFIPGTSPVYKVNGWMRSGTLDAEFEFYPRELGEELEESMELEKKNSHSPTTAGAKLEAEVENFGKERKVSDHIYGKQPDVFVSVFQLTDRAAHFAEKEDHLLEAYRETDEVIGEFMDRAEEQDVPLIVVSDHGMQQADIKFNLVSFLEERGYLELKEGSGDSFLYRLARPFLDTPLKKYMKYFHDFYQSRTGENLVGRDPGPLGSVSRESDAVPYFNGGREAGIRVVADDGQETAEELVEEFKSLERNGEPVFQNVWRGEELYPVAEEAPDIVVQARPGFTVSTEASSHVFDKTKSFTHDLEGVFFALGPGINEEAEEELEICDVAPLIYALLGEPIPDDMDGSLPAELVPDEKPGHRAMEVDDISV